MKRDAAEIAELARLLDAALELPPDDRPTWIDALPPSHDTLKPSLRKLLATKSANTQYTLGDLSRQVQAAVAGAAVLVEHLEFRDGACVGPYELMRELGRGGMGTVWLARRTEGLTRRVVALKLPHPGMLHAEFAARMGRERDILESLAHPNIARLYDAGVTPAGQPYLALEYVEGVSIGAYCDGRRLGVRERIRLFLQVLLAIQHAHSHLVIHRDLKPANILVTDTGTAMVLDFGIAKLMVEGVTADTALTQFGARALTPEFASPEQVAGQPLTTASDVYSLGVILYELLTGERPYRLARGSAAALEEAILAADVRRPSQAVTDEAEATARSTSASKLAATLRGDLDTIVLTAMRVQLAERYRTVDALAQDLERYLDGRAISARPEGWWEASRRFMVRHRLAMAVMSALALGLSAALWEAHAARLEAARAEQVKGFALSLLDSADTDAGAGATTTAVDLLQAANKRVEIELAGRPAIAAELMTAIGYGLLGQDHAEDAIPLLTRAIQLSTQTNGPEHVHTVEAQVILGEALHDVGRDEEAIALLKSTIGPAQRSHDKHAEIDAWRWLSSAQIDAGDVDGALASARASVAALPPFDSDSHPDDRALLDGLQAHTTLANTLYAYHKLGVVAEARAALSYASRMGKTVNGMDLDVKTLLGAGLMSEDQPAEGLKVLQGALAEARKFYGADHQKTAITASFLGRSGLEAGDVPTGLAAFQESFDAVIRNRAKHGPTSLAMTNYGLATALVAAHDYELALPRLDAAIPLFSKGAGPTAVMTLRARSAHALVLARMGRLDESEREFAALSTMPFAGPEKAAHLGRLSVLRSLQGKQSEAVTLAQFSVDGLATFPSKAIRGQSLVRLGTMLVAAHRESEAFAPLEQALALLNASQLPQSPDRAEAIAMLERARKTVVHAPSS